MGRRKPTTIYRSLFADAFRVAWERKSLWVFGLFAALLSTGGVYEMLSKDVRHLAAGRDLYLDLWRGTFAGTELFGRYLRDLLELEPARVTATVTLLVILALLLLLASVVSQGALIAGAGKKPISDRAAIAAGSRAFSSMLFLNILHKLAHLLLTALAALPLLLLLAKPDGGMLLAVFLAYLVSLPLTVFVATVFMLSSVDIVETGSHAFDAIEHALLVFRRHALAAFETGLILFCAVLVASFAFLVLLALLAMPFAVLISMALAAGSPFLFMTLNVLAVLVLLALFFCFTGATTTFQYAVWVRFCAHATAPRQKIVSKIHRIWIGK
jgi:hypothetical protein